MRKKIMFKKNVKDIQNVSCKGSDDIYIHFQRISPTEFERMYKSPSLWVCTGCGDIVDESTQDEHRSCMIGKITEGELAQFVGDFLVDDELNVVEFNEGCDDQCYISLY